MKCFGLFFPVLLLFSCDNPSAPPAAGGRLSADSSSAKIAGVALPAAPAALEPFSVVFHYKAGFLIGGKPVGKPGEDAVTVIADSMRAYIQRGGSIPDTLTCQFINDPATGAPLMGVRSSARDAVQEALAKVKKNAAPAFTVMLDKKGVHINGALVNSASDDLTPVIIDSMKAFRKRGGKIPGTVDGIFTYHSKDAEGMYHNEVKSFIRDALDSLKIK